LCVLTLRIVTSTRTEQLWVLSLRIVTSTQIYISNPTEIKDYMIVVWLF
jgi:hypothetical protein